MATEATVGQDVLRLGVRTPVTIESRPGATPPVEPFLRLGDLRTPHMYHELTRHIGRTRARDLLGLGG
ncbi:hypothetical protein GCM10027598_58930 [Amycolatopsis oliviviridis]|uniref:Uncharacterized protein n=1 Tax=Amycolatopsis oliviviridis TaxID=1471590 RepID=A0ABQ3LZD4_9PSEU|nr:hypothetical protein GCM10017790_59580 [Amycolatopsis oliviviridis]